MLEKIFKRKERKNIEAPEEKTSEAETEISLREGHVYPRNYYIGVQLVVDNLKITKNKEFFALANKDNVPEDVARQIGQLESEEYAIFQRRGLFLKEDSLERFAKRIIEFDDQIAGKQEYCGEIEKTITGRVISPEYRFNNTQFNLHSYRDFPYLNNIGPEYTKSNFGIMTINQQKNRWEFSCGVGVDLKRDLTLEELASLTNYFCGILGERGKTSCWVHQKIDG